MNRETVIQAYLMNKPRIIAEMLYDTIEKYEKKITELEKLIKDSK